MVKPVPVGGHMLTVVMLGVEAAIAVVAEAAVFGIAFGQESL